MQRKAVWLFELIEMFGWLYSEVRRLELFLADYDVKVDKTGLPPGVELIEML
jgi:hypothetical protein